MNLKKKNFFFEVMLLFTLEVDMTSTFCAYVELTLTACKITASQAGYCVSFKLKIPLV